MRFEKIIEMIEANNDGIITKIDCCMEYWDIIDRLVSPKEYSMIISLKRLLNSINKVIIYMIEMKDIYVIEKILIILLTFCIDFTSWI